MKEFFKNLRRYKVSSVLNILGLSIAFAAAYIIMVQVNFDLGYNRCFKDADKLYRLEFTSILGGENKWMPHAGHNVGLAVGDDNDNVVNYAWSYPLATKMDVAIPREGQEDEKLVANLRICGNSFPETMGIALVAGSYEEMYQPTSILVSETFAKVYGIELGDIVKVYDNTFMDTYNMPGGGSHTVRGIYADFPNNSDLANNQMLLLVDKGDTFNESEFAFTYYYRVIDASLNDNSLTNATRKVIDFLHDGLNVARPADDDSEAWEKTAKGIMRMTPIKKVHFANDVEGMIDYNIGSKSTTYTLLSIAVLILVIAFINFINFFMAMVPRRIRRVNTEKIFGCTTRRLRLGFIGEAIGLVAIGLVLAAYIVFMIAPELTGIVSTSTTLGDNPMTALLIAVAGLALAVVSSIYPAHYITSVPPAFAIKGSFGNSASGRRLRYILLTFQFVISIALITCTIFVRLQHSYMMKYDMGFNKEHLLTANLSAASEVHNDYNRRQQFANELKANPAITDVTFAMGQLVEPTRMTNGHENQRGEMVHYQCYHVAHNFLQFMGIEITEGRDFMPEEELLTGGVKLIFNEAAVRDGGIQLNDKLGGFADIVGICKDFKFRPLQYGVSPFAFSLKRHEGYLFQLYIRTAPNTDIEAVRKHIYDCMAKMGAEVSPEDVPIEFFDEQLGRQYEKERELNRLITIFALISICISLMGVFGLVFFETQYRRREIAVRRVHGAKISQILGMFVGQYARMVLVAFLFAVPVSYLIMQRWLEGYAYHIPLYWWVFALALLIVLAVTSAIVLARSWRAAKENPVEALYKE